MNYTSKKYILGFLILISTGYTHAADYQLWTNHTISAKPTKDLKLVVDQEYHIENDVKQFSYYHFEPSLYLRYAKENYIGLQNRMITQRKGHLNWPIEFQPAVVLTNIWNIGSLDMFATTKFLYRIKEGHWQYGAIRFKPGITIYKNDRIKLYMNNEFFFNYAGFHRFDQNRLLIGIKYNVGSIFSLGAYYLHQDEKKSKGARWTPSHIFGFNINFDI